MKNLINKFVINSTKNSRFRIICFCHAGGYATQYAEWKKFLPIDVECLIYERPGSGVRFGQVLLDKWDDLLKDVWQELKGFLDLPYIVFGHSLGASIGFEFCKLIQLNACVPPQEFFVGDREAPTCLPDKIRYNLPGNLFIESLVDDYELDHKIVNNVEIMDMFLPVLRADFKLADTYYEFNSMNKVSITTPITVIRPEITNDPIAAHVAWESATSKHTQVVKINGGHFFNFESAKETIKILTKNLALSGKNS